VRWNQRSDGWRAGPQAENAKRCRSEAGQRGRSVFAAAIAVFAMRYLPFPIWLWIGAAFIAALRLAGYAIGFVKHQTFSALHTYANKATGALIFTFPVLYAALGLTAAGVILCAAALLSSLEELVITINAPVLNRDCRGIFLK